MDVKFEKKSGRILSCTVEGKIRKAGDVLTIDATEVPKDFMAMFPLGKYLVKNDKIIKNRKFSMPTMPTLDMDEEINAVSPARKRRAKK